jgi:hypothetical protein
LKAAEKLNTGAARRMEGRAGAWVKSLPYLPKWLVLGGVIGVIAGLGAIVFYETLSLATHFFLGVLAGYHPPAPAGEGGGAGDATFARPWAIPLVAVLGALAAGFSCSPGRRRPRGTALTRPSTPCTGTRVASGCALSSSRSSRPR